VPAGEVVGGQLGGHAAPAEREPGADHRDLGEGVADRTQQVGQQAGQSEADEHEHDRQVAGVAGGAGRCGRRAAHHAEHDPGNRDVLFAPCVLAQHALAEEHQ